MEKWVLDIINEFKKRNNETYIGAVVGTVLSVDPLKVGILDNKVILDKSRLYICSNVTENYNRKATLGINNYTVGISATDSHGDTISSMEVNTKNDYDATVTYKNILNLDDKVLVIAAEDNQNFFIVDKLI